MTATAPSATSATGTNDASRPTPPRLVHARTPRAVLGFLAVGLLALITAMVISVRLGAGNVSFADVGNVLAAHLGLPSQPVTPVTDGILWDLRIPRVVTAGLVGASLALCGACLQALTRNPLAEPYLLGISSGASAGAVVVVVLGSGAVAIGLAGGALVGAMAALSLLLLLLRRSGLDSVRVVLTGVVVGQLFSAISSLVLMADGDAEATRAITFWLLGSMGAARWTTVLTCAIALLIGMVILAWYTNCLDALALGSDTAASLGVDVPRARKVLLVATSLMTAVAVAGVGAIGFVGLIVPHAVRFVVGPAHRYLLPCTALAGAVLLVVTDALCRIVFAPREVPVGVITALIGVPVFVLIMKKRGDL